MDVETLVACAHEADSQTQLLTSFPLLSPLEREELVTGLLSRGDKERTQRKRCYLLAANCLEYRHELSEETQAHIEQRIDNILPSSIRSAKTLAQLGDLVNAPLSRALSRSLTGTSPIPDKTLLTSALTLIFVDTPSGMQAYQAWIEAYVPDLIESLGSLWELQHFWKKTTHPAEYGQHVLAPTLPQWCMTDLYLRRFQSVESLGFFQELLCFWKKTTHPAEYGQHVLAPTLRKLGRTDLYLVRFQSIEGIQYLDMLEELYLYQCNELTDLTPLAGLSHLKRLTIHGNRSLEDIRPLAALSGLEDLFLLATHSLTDITPLGALHRLRRLHLRCKKLADVAPLAGLPELRSLIVEGSQRVDLVGMHHLPNLEALTIWKCSYLKSLGPLTDMPRLQTVTVSSCDALQDWSTLAQLSCLEKLFISGGYLDLPGASTRLNHLHTLDVSIGISLQDLTRLPRMPKLRSLTLSNCLNLQWLSGLHHLSSLTDLGLRYCRHLSTLQELHQVPTLQSLLIDSCESLRTLEGIQTLSKLEDLTIENSNSRLQDIIPLASLSHLRSLILNGYRTALDSSMELAQLVHLPPNLQRLHLRGFEHLQHLNQLPELPNLEILILDACTGLADIAALAHRPRLETMEIRSCLALASLESLKNLPQLRSLILRQEDVSLPWLPQLQEIGLHAANLQSLVQNAPNVSRLRLSLASHIDDISPLTTLTNLQELSIIGYGGDVTVLSLLPRLSKLWLVRDQLPSGLDQLQSRLPHLKIEYYRYTGAIWEKF